MNRFERIKALRDEINKMLEERPEYRHFQDEIDEWMKNIGTNPENRAAFLMSKMWDKFFEMAEGNYQLQAITKACSEIKKEIE